MSKRPFFPLYPGDYLSDTLHLTTEQHGVYFLLLLAYYSRRGPLPDDVPYLMQVTRLDARGWKRSGEPVLSYFRRENGLLLNTKADFVLGDQRRLSDARSEAGSRGNATRWQSQSDKSGVANGSPSSSSSSSDFSKTPLPPSQEGGSDCKDQGSDEDESLPFADQPAPRPRPSRVNGTNPRAMEQQHMDAEEQARADARRDKWAGRLAEYEKTGDWPAAWGPKPSTSKSIREAGVFLPAALHDEFRAIEARRNPK